MTALVTGVGSIPLALGVGELGKEIQQPMAIVILGGIFTSTSLNMIVIPALYLKYGLAEAASAARDYPQGSEFAPSVLANPKFGQSEILHCFSLPLLER